MAMSGDGLFSKARNAADKYKKAQEDEAELISEIGREMNSEYVGAFVTGYEPTEGTCTITKEQSGVGTDVTKDSNEVTIEKDMNGNQTFTTTAEGKLQWRIWDYDGTTLRIILDKSTTQKLALKGVAGYNNGVYIVNEICRKCFGQYEDGEMKQGISVANLRRSDIERVSTYDYTKYKHGLHDWREVIENSGNDEEVIYYGETKSFKEDFEAPKMWSVYDSTWDYRYDKNTKDRIGDARINEIWEKEFNYQKEIEKGNTTKETEFTQSFYAHNYLNNEEEFKDLKYYNLLFRTADNSAPSGRKYLACRTFYISL